MSMIKAAELGFHYMDLYTKDGRPLQVSGETIYSRSDA
jgi:hypothetical protein